MLAIFLTASQAEWEPALEQGEAAPACGTEAQLGLEATELEMTHSWRELLLPRHLVLHPPA